MRESQLRQVWDKTKGHCHFRGDPVEFAKRGWHGGDLTGYWEIDHVIQRDKGGIDSADNHLPACTRCNRLRWHRTGDRIRELLLLGLVAKDEIKKGTARGHALRELREKRRLANQKRRKISAVPALTGYAHVSPPRIRERPRYPTTAPSV